MSAVVLELQNLYQRYVKWVSTNPGSLGDVELTAKWLSYFIAGKINNSSAVSELVYSLSNLLVFANDRIIERAHRTVADDSQEPIERRIKVLLTTLEYCEVFIELSAHKIWGTKGKWFIICVIQLIKCLGRLVLTSCYSSTKIVTNPPIPALNRKTVSQQSSAGNESFNANLRNGAIVLKRSGRVMRKVECSPSLASRSWKPPLSANEISPILGTQYGGKQLMSAELVYILKPLIHLGCMHRYGTKSWKAYLVALALDGISLRKYYNNRQALSKEQRVELSRRCVSLLLYLMRSPFYDRYTHDKIACLLNGIGNNVPLTGSIARLILSYIPHWQETYFYMWSS
ncbi:peroxisomal membrane protein PEX16 [Anopheles darlingi]|uniref:Peroxisomal membrane protein PEX16 n=1 Tax=Anopheles darlingi TaxID=43151 RepID=W5JTR9_ANODA|nr:peroxisomal membrane protein PEX16 [Anopheles darlingi]ETN66350.1 peroxisomal membrane protein PEX16 [Anopheles darlingi]